MDSMDKSVPETEYQKGFTSYKVVSQCDNSKDTLSQTEYKRSFPWPKQTQIGPQPVLEPPLVVEWAVPQDANSKRSWKISDPAEVADKFEAHLAREAHAVPAVKKRRNKTEYESKFLPFDYYMYVTGSGFVKPEDLSRLDKVDMARDWFTEATERSRQASEYKTRSELEHNCY